MQDCLDGLAIRRDIFDRSGRGLHRLLAGGSFSPPSHRQQYFRPPPTESFISPPCLLARREFVEEDEDVDDGCSWKEVYED
jgi:hypothetical protein